MGTATGLHPKVEEAYVPVPAVAGGADLETPIMRAPFTGTLTTLTYSPISAITGAATNNRTLSLINKGTNGSGTTVVATLNYANTINASASKENTITLSATAANLNVLEGEILSWSSVHVGTGIADPGGMVYIKLTRD